MFLVFDAQEWSKTGDIGDNSQFWKPAKIIRMYFNCPYHDERLADVQFADGRISCGHFVQMFRPLAEQPAAPTKATSSDALPDPPR